jgi:hypothetical protein
MRPMYIATWMHFFQARHISVKAIEARIGVHHSTVYRWRDGKLAVAPTHQPALRAMILEAITEMVHYAFPSRGIQQTLSDIVTQWENEIAARRGAIMGKAVLAIQTARELYSQPDTPWDVERIERLKMARRDISRGIRLKDPRLPKWQSGGHQLYAPRETLQQTFERFERLWAWHADDPHETAAMYREAMGKQEAARLAAALQPYVSPSLGAG